jgi:histone acetyltransferase (RNA polymerase elongator complex component)
MNTTTTDLRSVGIKAPPTPSKWEIPLTQGKVTLVDEEDYEILASYKWHARKDHKTFYATRRDGYGSVSMHRCVAVRMGIIPTVFDKREIDHINRNGLDNTRINLRVASRSQNAANRNAKGYTIEHGRVRKYKVVVGGKYIGRFKTEQEAVDAYILAKKEVYGEFS